MTKNKTIIYLLALNLIWSCQNKTSQDWYIGTYQLLDQTIPYPELLTSVNNAGYLFNNKGEIIDTCKLDSGLFQRRDTLDFGDKSYRICHVADSSMSIYDLKQPVLFYKTKDSAMVSKNRAWFEKLKEYDLPPISEMNSELKRAVWKYTTHDETPNNDLTIEHYLTFVEDQLHHIRSYGYEGTPLWSEIEYKSYSLFEKGPHQFLSIIDDEDNPQPMLQITKSDNEGIKMLNFSDIIRRKESLTEAWMTKVEFEAFAEQSRPYQNCSDGYVGEYYYNSDTYPKGNEYIKRWVSEDLPNSIENGSVIIHYNINCEGDIGRFGLQCMDMNFQPCTFSKEIVTHLMNKVSELEDWSAIENDNWWLRHKDAHGFLMFNIRNGVIVDVCP